MDKNADIKNAVSWKSDAAIIGELAKRYAEIASLPSMQKRKQRMMENNGLLAGRPPVLLHELPWHELNIDGKLSLKCENRFAMDIEQRLKRILYQWEYCRGDMYVEPVFTLSKAYESTGNGLDVVENARHTDDKNNIYSHEYIDQLENEDALDKFKMPVITAFPERDAQNAKLASELLGGTLDVELRGYEIYHAPWDRIAQYRGVTPILMDMHDRPEHLHKIIKMLTDAAIYEYEQYERLGLLEYRNTYLHCTPAFSNDIPAADYRTGEAPRFSDVWFRSMAQMFSDISPEMHLEFDVQYGKQLADRCALTYYGCCEPLHKRIAMLKDNLKNLRKIGVTPWADEESCAEQIGRDYVYAKKPNPANVAIIADPSIIRAETVKTIEICNKYGCAYELVLKDISTVSYKPGNLTIWANTVKETLDGYYGAAE